MVKGIYIGQLHVVNRANPFIRWAEGRPDADLQSWMEAMLTSRVLDETAQLRHCQMLLEWIHTVRQQTLDLYREQGRSGTTCTLSRQPLMEAILRTLIGDYDNLRFPALQETVTSISLSLWMSYFILNSSAGPVSGGQEPYADMAAELWELEKVMEVSNAARSIAEAKRMEGFSDEEQDRRLQVVIDKAERDQGARDILALPEQELLEMSIKAFEALGRKAYSRQFALTSNGVMAQVPDDAIEGDVIAVLAGAKVAYLLRPKEGSELVFQLVGEAYVHGAMDGKFFPKFVRDRPSEFEWITIM
jgi:hypothetical protein